MKLTLSAEGWHTPSFSAPGLQCSLYIRMEAGHCKEGPPIYSIVQSQITVMCPIIWQTYIINVASTRYSTFSSATMALCAQRHQSSEVLTLMNSCLVIKLCSEAPGDYLDFIVKKPDAENK